MCKHILNAQVAIRAPCCKGWFDCAECHAEKVDEDHELERATEMTLACKKCKKVFRLDMEQAEESDMYCPRCDNCFYVEAVTPEDKGQLVLQVEAIDGKESELIRDERVKQKEHSTMSFTY